jgi:hypothetical protein
MGLSDDEMARRGHLAARNATATESGQGRSADEVAQVIGASVTYLTTVHSAAAFGVLAVFASSSALAQSTLLRGALVAFLVGLVIVGLYLERTWAQVLHYSAAHDEEAVAWWKRQRRLTWQRVASAYGSFAAFVVGAGMVCWRLLA